jgi:tetratricopeptide (TPR) repeat protein
MKSMKQVSRGAGVRRWGPVLGLVAAVASAGSAHAQAPSNCGPLQNAYGPFDYRTSKAQLQVVEEHHFTRKVETLVAGQEGYVGQDIDYTLRASPNHHRALIAVMRWGEKHKSPQPRDLQYPVECYFERALRFKPDDTTARMLYANYLLRNKREAAANAELDRVVKMAGDNAFTHYNAGLVYLDAKNYDKALQQAHTAYGLGFPRTDLKQKLVAAGKWRDAPAAAAGGASAAPAAAAASDAPAVSGTAGASTAR